MLLSWRTILIPNKKPGPIFDQIGLGFLDTDFHQTLQQTIPAKLNADSSCAYGISFYADHGS